MTKRQRATRRRQRAKAKVLCAIDWETRGHYHIGDSHFGCNQLFAYARMADIDEVMVIHVGDLIHHGYSRTETIK